tara:strand:+ start:1023 stop:1532 length:510 start_codon:yes stop_codon:yes gene_type:complete
MPTGQTYAQRKEAAAKRRAALAKKRKAAVSKIKAKAKSVGSKIKSKAKSVGSKIKSRVKGATAKYQGTKVDRKSVRGVTKTKGGNYPKYAKGSAKGKDFNAKLRAARKKKQKTMTWDGRKYTTGVKKTTRKGNTYTNVVGKGSRLKNMSSKMKANAAARRKKRAAKKKK